MSKLAGQNKAEIYKVTIRRLTTWGKEELKELGKARQLISFIHTTVKVELNKVLTKMQVDTGTSVSLINKHIYLWLYSALAKVRGQVKTYTSEFVGILEEAKAEVKYGEIKYII